MGDGPASAKYEDSFQRYLEEVERYPMIEDRETEREVARRAREGDREARERLVTANLRFVISYVKKYRGRGLSLPELVAVGNRGLVKAADRFDPERGVKFITYAVWWIRQAVFQALAEQGRPVRVPTNQNTQIHRYQKTYARLYQKHGRPPHDREMAAAMDVDEEAVQLLARLARSPVRLDAPIGDDENGRTHANRLPGDTAEAIRELLAHRDRQDEVREVLHAVLSPRERKIVSLYYGLDGGEGLTLAEIGELLGVTRERIRQLRNRAFEKLRRSRKADRLRAAWDDEGRRPPSLFSSG